WVFGVFFLLEAYSRLYLGEHWPMDVVGGTVVGAVWLWWTLKTLQPLHRTAIAAAGDVARPAPPERRAPG
ncbi:MAG: phosphatase PAP2 family protein, partial [Longimicrobiales bacterium]